MSTHSVVSIPTQQISYPPSWGEPTDFSLPTKHIKFVIEAIQEDLRRDPTLIKDPSLQTFCETLEEFNGYENLDQMSKKLKADLKNKKIITDIDEIKYLVNIYYIIQGYRIRAGGQYFSSEDREYTKRNGEKAIKKVKVEKPQKVLIHTFYQFKNLEEQIKLALDMFSINHNVGRWLRSIVGIGPVIASGILANSDISIATTAGKLHRYAGLDPTIKWLGKEKANQVVKEAIGDRKVFTYEELSSLALAHNRNVALMEQRVRDEKGEITRALVIAELARMPWNQTLKTLTVFKAGESFIKFQNHKDCFYGKLLIQRKVWELAQNEKGVYADFAAQQLKEKSYDKGTEAYKALIQGKLSVGHIIARARRWAVKIFLSHYQAVAFEQIFHKPAPIPYVIAYKGHQDFISVPNTRINKTTGLMDLLVGDYAESDD